MPSSALESFMNSAGVTSGTAKGPCVHRKAGKISAAYNISTRNHQPPSCASPTLLIGFVSTVLATNYLFVIGFFHHGHQTEDGRYVWCR